MERYIDQQGKTEEFRRVFEEKKGKPWLEMRRAFAFNGKFIIQMCIRDRDRTLTIEKTDGEIAEDNLDWAKEADMDAALDFADSF